MTAEEFIREKIRAKNAFPEKYVMEGLQNYSVTGEECLRWAHEYAKNEIIEELESLYSRGCHSEYLREAIKESIDEIKNPRPI